MKKHSVVAALALLLPAFAGCNATSTSGDTSLPPVVTADTNILIIGDSLSLLPLPYIQDALPCVAHNPGNAMDSRNIVENVRQWLGNRHYKLIRFNSGMWDIAHRSNLSKRSDRLYDVTKAPVSVSLPEYIQNLSEIVPVLQAHADVVVWVNTTDVPADSIGRLDSEAVSYNAAAATVMSAYGIPTDDIRTFMLQYEDHHDDEDGNRVHYDEFGSEQLAHHEIKSITSYGGCD